jgi:hypothetical protein
VGVVERGGVGELSTRALSATVFGHPATSGALDHSPRFPLMQSLESEPWLLLHVIEAERAVFVEQRHLR